jgi:hypothetical protein
VMVVQRPDLLSTNSPFLMMTMRWVVGRCFVGCWWPVFSFAGAVRPMTTTRLPIFCFMAVTFRAMAIMTYDKCTDDHIACQGFLQPIF